MNHAHFIIRSVVASAPTGLTLTFDDGVSLTVDLAPVIARHPTLARLRDPQVFQDVAPDEWNRGVIFAGDDELTLASDNLRALAIEQHGGFSHQQVITWMHHHDMTLDSASAALDISRRMLAYYRSGEKDIPRTIGLALIGYDVVARRGVGGAFDYQAVA